MACSLLPKSAPPLNSIFLHHCGLCIQARELAMQGLKPDKENISKQPHINQGLLPPFMSYTASEVADTHVTGLGISHLEKQCRKLLTVMST